MQIISGKGNPLARAAARGEAAHESAMQQAVAYDLDILQRLAVTETTLSGTLTAGITSVSSAAMHQFRIPPHVASDLRSEDGFISHFRQIRMDVEFMQ